jgi:hypothetical protein
MKSLYSFAAIFDLMSFAIAQILAANCCLFIDKEKIRSKTYDTVLIFNFLARRNGKIPLRNGTLDVNAIFQVDYKKRGAIQSP